VNACSNNFHHSTTNRTGDGGSFFITVGKHAEWIDPQHHLKEFNEFLAAGMKEPVTPCPAKTLWQNMEHEQVKELFPAHGPDLVLFGLGRLVTKGHPTVFTSQDVLFLDDSPVEIPPEIDDGLVAVADVFAMNDPLFGAIPGNFQAVIDQSFQHL
jgi:hypothetical protein